MRRLAEDFVHLLCSSLSAVESSLNRDGTKVVRGGVGERAVERTAGVRAAEAITMSVVICLPMDVT
jgi:hypothetical protein